MEADIQRVALAIARAERILVITGAGLSADSGLPTYRGLGGLYNGHADEGLPIEAALSGPMLQRDPALCWKYLAELGKACLGARANAGHFALAELQRRRDQIAGLEERLAAARRTPEKLARLMADIEARARAKLDDIQGAATGDRVLLRELFAGLFPEGLLFEPTTVGGRDVW